MIVLLRAAFRWTYFEKIEENCQLREKFIKTIFENAILQYFWRWIQWNTLENSIPNNFRRILKIHHFRPHSGTSSQIVRYQASKYSSVTTLRICIYSMFLTEFDSDAPRIISHRTHEENYTRVKKKHVKIKKITKFSKNSRRPNHIILIWKLSKF